MPNVAFAIPSPETLHDLWILLFPEKELLYNKRQVDYLAYGSNYHPFFKKIVKTTEMDSLNEVEAVRYTPKYRVHRIRKADGTHRIIREPCRVLKLIQRKILTSILGPYSESTLSSNCTGFRKDFSIVDNARLHLGKKIMIKVDISDFFPSISQARVYRMFQKRFGYNHVIASYLSGLCTFENELPQGAPTSPTIANIICSRLDSRIISLIASLNKKMPLANAEYSRYADDIVISYDEKCLNPDKTIGLIRSIIEDEGFLVNMRKIGVFDSGKRMEVTGIVVNNKHPSIGRKRYKELRAMINSIRTLGWDEAMTRWNEKHRKKSQKATSVQHFKQIVQGLRGYLVMLKKGGDVSSYWKDFESILPDFEENA